MPFAKTVSSDKSRIAPDANLSTAVFIFYSFLLCLRTVGYALGHRRTTLTLVIDRYSSAMNRRIFWLRYIVAALIAARHRQNLISIANARPLPPTRLFFRPRLSFAYCTNNPFVYSWCPSQQTTRSSLKTSGRKPGLAVKPLAKRVRCAANAASALRTRFIGGPSQQGLQRPATVS